MEDVFKFLLVAAVIVIGLVKQYKKEARGKAAEEPGSPLPDTDAPLPEPWAGGTYGGFIPEGPPAPKPKPAPRPASKPRSTSKKTSPSPPPSAAVPPTPDDTASDYAIHSAEEARKAIIWSEILQRKY